MITNHRRSGDLFKAAETLMKLTLTQLKWETILLNTLDGGSKMNGIRPVILLTRQSLKGPHPASLTTLRWLVGVTNGRPECRNQRLLKQQFKDLRILHPEAVSAKRAIVTAIRGWGHLEAAGIP